MFSSGVFLTRKRDSVFEIFCQGKRRGGQAFLFVFFTLILFSLSACSFGESTKSTEPPPSSAATQNLQADEKQPPRPIDALKALSPPEGLKTKRLFAAGVKDGDERFSRLESNVQQLRDDLDVAVPTLVRLAAVEKDMNDLFRQLSTLVNGQGKSPSEIQAEEMPPLPPLPLSNSGEMKTPVTKTPLQGNPVGQPTTQTEESEPPAVATQQPPAEASLNTTSPAVAESPEPAEKLEKKEADSAKPPLPPATYQVSGVRIGEHPDKTRLVIELSGKAGYFAKIADGKLVIELSDTAWNGVKSWSSDSSPLLYAYHVEDDGKGGVRLTGDLLYDATIVSQSLYPAEGRANAGVRLVIDLKSAVVHR